MFVNLTHIYSFGLCLQNMPSDTSWQSEMINISHRIEGVITFTLIRYVFSVLNSKTDINSIVVYSIWLLNLIFGLSYLKISDAAINEILQIFKKLSILLINQCIIIGASRQDVADADASTCLIVFVQLITILSFAFILSQVLHMPEYTNRGLTLLLYMFTDASNDILKSLNLEFAAVSVCLGVYVTYHIIDRVTELSELTNFFLRGLNMISINLILNTLLTNSNITNIHTTTILSLFFLYILTAVEKIWAPIAESKDYALWRSAQNIYELYSKYEKDFLVSMFLVLLFLMFRALFSKLQQERFATMLNLIALFLVNVLLGLVSDVILATQSTYQVIVMLIYVILIHYGTYCTLLVA